LLDVIAEQIDESDMEKHRLNHLILAEHGIIEEPKQIGDAGEELPKPKSSYLVALTVRPTVLSG